MFNNRKHVQKNNVELGRGGCRDSKDKRPEKIKKLILLFSLTSWISPIFLITSKIMRSMMRGPISGLSSRVVTILEKEKHHKLYI